MGGAVKYADCISAEGQDPPSTLNEYPGYNAKQSDGEAPVLELWGMWNTFSLPLFEVHFDPES